MGGDGKTLSGIAAVAALALVAGASQAGVLAQWGRAVAASPLPVSHATPAPAACGPMVTAHSVADGLQAATGVHAAAYTPVRLQSKIDRVQPMTGIVLWNDNTAGLAALGNDIQLEFAYFRYADVVRGPDDYDWAPVEARLASAAARGHQMIVRFHDTYPGQTTVPVPPHVANAADHTASFPDIEGRRTYVPDWRSATLRAFVLEFYTRFAQRYDRDARLAFVQVGFGSYAEYHLWDGPLTLGRTFPSKAFQQQFLTHLGSTFVHTPWSLSIDAASSTYSPFSSVASLRQLRFGLFDDSFMHETHSTSAREYNRASWNFFGAGRWRIAPAGGEFSYYSDYDQAHVLDLPDGAWDRRFESFAAQYRISYMIGNDQPRYQPRARIRQAGRATGYAFRVTALSSNGECVRLTVRNEGVAPIYHDAWPAVNGRRIGASLKGLAPGTAQAASACIGAHARTRLQVAIQSDRLVPGQRIQFNASLP